MEVSAEAQRQQNQSEDSLSLRVTRGVLKGCNLRGVQLMVGRVKGTI